MKKYQSSLFAYKWQLSDQYNAVPKNNLKVFGTFVCGGGSTMGYKLAGYDHLGGVELDKKIAEIYKKNHNPKHLFVQDIRDFNKQVNKQQYPELFELDLLDGSPPCSTFSMAGSREKAWGIEKQFKEGQKKQQLDDLFFEWIETVRILQPKVAIAENVKGLLIGNAQVYLTEIIKKLNEIDYNVQVFLLNGATMGLPQRRERVFIICSQKKLNFPKLELNFNCQPIYYKDIEIQNNNKNITDTLLKLWVKTMAGKDFSDAHATGSFFNYCKVSPNKVLPTIVANDIKLYHYKTPRKLLSQELITASSFPQNYNFGNVQPYYLLGMSVPPVMMAQISHQIYLQWLSKI
jgi:DNA (cytosine-5)-methyltransferase 1